MTYAPLLFACVAALSACKDGGSGPPDAAPIDTPSGGDGAVTDSSIDALANVCTGLLYDSCTTNAQCASNNCKLFNGAALQICTQACSASVPCPAQNGVAVACNNMGVCRPNAANTCTPP